MADVFISFATSDATRVGVVADALRERGISVFWSMEIPKGAPDYHAVIKAEMNIARLVLVAWTKTSVLSHPVSQECAQAERGGKLIQVLLDDIEPIEFPMEVRYRAQKTRLVDWAGNRRHPEWIALIAAIDARLANDPHNDYHPPDDLCRIFQISTAQASLLNQLGIFRFDQIARWTGADVESISADLGISGLIERDNWIDQAKLLAAGTDTSFSRDYDARRAG